MEGRGKTEFMVILAVALVLLVVPALSGCGSPIGERVSGIVKSLNPAPTATSSPATAPPATLEPSPTSAPPTSLPPSPTASPRPTRTAVPTPSVAPTRAPDAVVTADALTLRAGPGTVYARLGMLRKGNPLTVTARNQAGDWLAVTAPSGKQGWVAAAYVELNRPLEGVSITAEVPPTPVPPPTQPPTEAAPAESQPTAAPATGAPTGGPSVDEQIAEINQGQHGELPQPSTVGSVAAGGEAELTILNDTPYVLTVLIGSPNRTTVTIEQCSTCSTYGAAGPLFCQEEGRPRQTIRIKPGSMKVAARVDNPSVIPFSGEWTLNPDSAYFNCFFIVTS
jgi:Bacterial SH3 domain